MAENKKQILDALLNELENMDQSYDSNKNGRSYVSRSKIVFPRFPIRNGILGKSYFSETNRKITLIRNDGPEYVVVSIGGSENVTLHKDYQVAEWSADREQEVILDRIKYLCTIIEQRSLIGMGEKLHLAELKGLIDRVSKLPDNLISSWTIQQHKVYLGIKE